MSSRRSNTVSKRKRTTPQKLKSRKVFAVSRNDLAEESDGEDQFPEMLTDRENVPKSPLQTLSKKESLTETPQNKENMPEKYPSSSASPHKGRGRPKGSKNKTFPFFPTKVYSVREGKSVYFPKRDDVETPSRGRGRPKGSVKVKPISEDIPKKSRGRPKGSKNRKPSKAAMMKRSPGLPKLGRGRPRKLPLTEEGAIPKRGRGRPKGSLNKVASVKKEVTMSSRRSNTISKRKRTTPQKLKSCKVFAVSRNDLAEESDGEDQFPEMLTDRENVPKSPLQTLSKKESLTETPQNKENMPEKYPSSSASPHKGRGRPKGSKNKTFPFLPTKVYSVREGKSVYFPKRDDVETPSRGRGRPKGTVKVKPIGEDIPKKSRGRPKGSKNRKPSKATMMKRSPGLPKLGRGRPRKLPLTEEGVIPKRGRGRPRGSLNKVVSVKKPAVLSGTHEIKKRGRPKKIRLHQSDESPLTPKRPRGRPKSTGSRAAAPSNLLSEYDTNMEDDYKNVKEEEEDDNYEQQDENDDSYE